MLGKSSVHLGYLPIFDHAPIINLKQYSKNYTFASNLFHCEQRGFLVVNNSGTWLINHLP